MKIKVLSLVSLLILGISFGVTAQDNSSTNKTKKDVHVVTIPVSIYSKDKKDDKSAGDLLNAGVIRVKEDNEEQEVLSIRSISNTPLSLEILIQDDLTSAANLNQDEIKKFILTLPQGTRVMVGYIRGGSLDVRQPFTTNLKAAADSLRIVGGNAGVAPASPYDGVIEGLQLFEAQPIGRRAMLLISDGLDVSGGVRYSTPSDSNSLSRAIDGAQQTGVAVYTIYTSATYTQTGNNYLVSNGQNSLEKLSDSTGGESYFSGSFSPVSYAPFLEQFEQALNRQFALSYLSTHSKKGYHRIQVISTNTDVKIDYPDGYYYK